MQMDFSGYYVMLYCIYGCPLLPYLGAIYTCGYYIRTISCTSVDSSELLPKYCKFYQHATILL